MDGQSLQVRVLASSSSGNAIFVQMGDTRILVDVGISCRRIQTALSDLDLELADLDAVLVTHEHSDHVKGIERVHKVAPNLPLYATRGTAGRWLHRHKVELPWKTVDPDWRFDIGEVSVHPFTVLHDAAEPVGYRFETPDAALCIATDLGESSKAVEHALTDVQCIVLEANHDEDMLRDGPYPWHLKRRVGSRRGHLSNVQSQQLLRKVAGPRLEHVILGHLSGENNDPCRAVDTIAEALDGLDVTLMAADRKAPGDLFAFERSFPLGRVPKPRQPRQGMLPFF